MSSALPRTERAAQRRISTALFLAGFATFSLIYCTQPLLPEFSTEFGIDPATSSLALSLTTGCLAFSILAAGALSEAVGRRGLMFVSMVGAALLNLVSAMAPSWELLLIARACEGLVLGGVPAVAMAYLAEEMPAGRLGRAMGLYVGGTAFGGMIGRVAIGALTEATSWRIALGSMAAVDLVVAFGFLALAPASRNFVRRPGLNPALHLAAWATHLRHRELPFLFLTGFLSMGAFVTIYNYAGYRLLAAPYSLSQAQIGLIFLTYIFGILASSSAGSLADRMGRPPVVITGVAVMLTGMLATLSSALWLIIGGIAVITVGFFMVHSVASGWVGRLASTNRSHAASLYLLSYYVGSSVMGSLGGWFWHEGAWPAVIVFCATLTLCVCAIALWLRRAGRG
ncbi:MFS transporter [Paroceanicella profunda]|uniref:MFS transporter n=1 Tax=Paroceanicella profunda TaxID=2579971 RepID=A0A5B8FH34_9RHOB|nr:MFS transporter [Paroceanicella profunda]QDL91951.1 MFS transporter [Paroceanicella profunda]